MARSNPSKAERLHRVFDDFAAAVVGLKEYIAADEKEEGLPPSGPEHFYDERMAPLALETLCLWVQRVKGLPKGPKGEKLGSNRLPNVLDKIGEVAADAMNTLLLVQPDRCSEMLGQAGAVSALIHAIDVSPTPAVQCAAACALQNLASVSDELRRDIAEAGGVRPTVKMLRRPDIPPVVAHAACSVLQNLAILPANEEVLVEAGSIEVLLQQCSKYTKVKDYVAARDQRVVEAAALAIMNLSAGAASCKAIADSNAIPVLASLLVLHPRNNPLTAVLEHPTPPLLLIHAAAASLRGLAILPDQQGPLRSARCVQHVGILMQRLLEEQLWLPSDLKAAQGDALISLLGFVRNMSLLDSGALTREQCIASKLGVSVGKFLTRLVPKDHPDAMQPSSPQPRALDRAESPQRASKTKTPDLRAKSPDLRAHSPPKTPQRTPAMRKPEAGANSLPAGGVGASASASAAVNGVSGVAILEAIAAARNLSASLPAMQEQLGASGAVEAVVALINKSPAAAWVTTEALVEALSCLANLTEASEQNRSRALAAACVRQVLCFASATLPVQLGGYTTTHRCNQVVGAACLVIHSMMQAPEARMKLIERDGLKLLYHLLDRVSTPEVTAGAAGALVHLGQSTKLHLQKFVQLGGSKLLTRVAQDCSSNGALLQLLKLIYLMAVDTELKHVLTEDGLLRVALALLGKKPALPEAMLEICSGAVAAVAKDKHARSHMLKMGALQVLTEVNDAYGKQNEKIKGNTRRAINLLLEGRVDEGK